MSRSPDPAAIGKAFFRDYYRKLSPEDIDVSSFPMREFAFSYFEGTGMQRHEAFHTPVDLVEHLRQTVPRHIYHSSAYYINPSAKDMDSKGWQGADLVFDIDVDHVKTPCKELHDSWTCKKCGATGRGTCEKCPKCGSESIEKEVWVCERCINVARDEVLKLIDFLENDFGISRDEMAVTFSGHRGFHVHVESETVRSLGQDGRREIVDYIKGLGLDYKQILARVPGGFKLRFDSSASSWYGRIARWATLYSSDSELVMDLKTWQTIIEKCISSEGAAIDEKVTVDIHRLIRLKNSLHGKTGLKAAALSIGELESQHLLDRVKVFKGEALVDVKKVPQVVLDINLKEGRQRIPLYVALYLLLNGAEIASFQVL